MRIRIYGLISPVLLLVLLLKPLCAAEPRQTKRVLVLYSEDKAHPAHELTGLGIRTAFRSNKLFDAQIYDEYLDLSRFGGSDHALAVADYLNRKCDGTESDAIITVYPAAMHFLMHEEGNVFPGEPIVACEIIRDSAEDSLQAGFRGSPGYLIHDIHLPGMNGLDLKI